MKKDIHPKMQEVIFLDTSCGKKFKLKSTLTSDKTDIWDDGKEYPLINVETSSASHPIYTGKSKIVASEGRIAKFQNKFNMKFSAQKKDNK